MKTLIIGGTSSVGKALKPLLEKHGPVLTTGRKDCDILLDLGNHFENIDIPSDIDILIHAAANFGGKSAQEIVEAESINALGTLKLCQAAAQAKVRRIILISSVFATQVESSEQFGIYGLSKRHGEDLARWVCTRNCIPLTILRPSQLYGNENSHARHQPFLYHIVERAEKGEEVVLFGSNDAYRNYLHIEDFTAIIGKVVESNITGEYQCMNQLHVRYSQIAKAAFAAFETKERITFLPEKPNIPDNTFPIDLRLYHALNFYPVITIEQGMQKLAKYRGYKR